MKIIEYYSSLMTGSIIMSLAVRVSPSESNNGLNTCWGFYVELFNLERFNNIYL